MRFLIGVFALLVCSLQGASRLSLYAIDVEGGQATLVVSPSGESLLIDSGWGGFDGRDASRIVAAAKAAGVKRIDYLVTTHYHVDHAGGVPQLAEKLPIVTFVDHGPSTEAGERGGELLYKSYLAAREKGKHLQVKAGDTLPVKGIDVRVLSAAGDVMNTTLAGAGQTTASCATFTPPPDDTTENAQSIGLLITFGDFRILDLGDLTADRDWRLACPTTKIGPVDLMIVANHGTADATSAPLVTAVRPRVALLNNGPKKGNSSEIWHRVKNSPESPDIWQLHFSAEGAKDYNSPDMFIANVDDPCAGDFVRVTAFKDGAFSVFNSRNHYEKLYQAR
jgi:competence protein ComEC